jgi:hypothetical protein
VEPTTKRTKDHFRLRQILNRNTFHDEDKFNRLEIIVAFKQREYGSLNRREKIIINRFFKECDIEDARDLIIRIGIAKLNIKMLFKTSPFMSKEGYDIWFDFLNL